MARLLTAHSTDVSFMTPVLQRGPYKCYDIFRPYGVTELQEDFLIYWRSLAIARTARHLCPAPCYPHGGCDRMALPLFERAKTTAVRESHKSRPVCMQNITLAHA